MRYLIPIFILFITILLSFLLAPIEQPRVVVKGNADIPLKTTNGCGQAYTVIVNKGNAAIGIPPGIGYLRYYPTQYFSTFTLNDTIIDVAFADVFAQDYSSGDLKYFAVITSGKVYLYSMQPSGNYGDPMIVLEDSINTPDGYLKSCLVDGYSLSQLLLVSQPPDSTSYSYTFYSLPSLDLLSQVSMNINPEKIVQESYPVNYILSGDSVGSHKIFKISSSTFQVVESYVLPLEADNVKDHMGHSNTVYLLSAPGDTVINFTEFDETNSTSTVTSILHNAGISVSSTYHYDEFLIQPSVDSSISTLGNKILSVSASNQGVVVDTFDFNKKAIAIEGGYYLGFGGLYDFIVATTQNLPNDWVYYWHYGFDSIQTGANPTWFIGDVRCYINVEQIEKNLDIKFGPNPASEDVQIFVSGLAENKTYDFTISDINGKILWNQKLLTKSEYVIPVSNFPSGILILKVDAGSKVVTEKILKL